MIEVRCPNCCRIEEWSAGGRRVVSEGGHRKAALHPVLRDWRTWDRARRGESGPVVGRCAACERLVVASAPTDEISSLGEIELQTAQGTLVLGLDGVRGPEGLLDAATVGQRLEAELTPRETARERALAVLRTLPLAFVLAPLALWLLALSFVAFFILGVFSTH